jgi:hypothetical protein
MARRFPTTRLHGEATYTDESAAARAIALMHEYAESAGQPQLGATLEAWLQKAGSTLSMDVELEIPPPVAALFQRLLHELSESAEHSDLRADPG